MYFLRLVQLKPIVEEIAAEAWDDFKVFAAAPPGSLKDSR